MPQITKTRTSVYNVLQVAVDFLTFDEKYRKIRGGCKYKGFECYACNKHFQDDEKISLLVTDRGNKTACHKCATNFKSELVKEE